jgi:hypothetical protein
MGDPKDVGVVLPADVQQTDGSGFVWTFLDEASDPGLVYPGAEIVAGDPIEPFLARVVEIVERPGRPAIVHLDVIGVP